MGLICQNLLVPLQFECGGRERKKEKFPACYSYNWATTLVLLRTCVRHTAAGKTIKSNVAEEIREQIYQMSWRVVVSNQSANLPLTFSSGTTEPNDSEGKNTGKVWESKWPDYYIPITILSLAV